MNLANVLLVEGRSGPVSIAEVLEAFPHLRSKKILEKKEGQILHFVLKLLVVCGYLILSTRVDGKSSVGEIMGER